MPYSLPGQSRLRLQRVAAVIAAATLVVVSGWASSGDSSEMDAKRRPIGALGPGFIDPVAPPPPGGIS